MDYGYQLLRHVVQQVFGNLGAAARITLALYLSPLVVLLVLTGGALLTIDFQNPPTDIGGVLFAFLLTAVVAVIAYCWAAVGWHRYVLLEELGRSIFPQWHKGLVGTYFIRALIIGLILIAAMIAGSFVLLIIVGASGSLGVALAMGIGLVFFVSWVATRIGLILPAAALGERMTVGESWQATAPVSGQILLPLIVIAIAFGVLAQLNIVIFGQPVTGFEDLAELQNVPGFQQPRVLSLPGQLVSAVLTWLQLLMNLALMTTLYGNRIEGRPLN